MTARKKIKPAKRTWKLPKKAKVFICQRLAEFGEAEKIALEVEERFNVQVTRQGIHQLIRQRRTKGTHWNELMAQFRKEYLEAVQDVPIANKKKRLEYLEKAYDRAIQWHTVPSAAGPIEKCLPAAAVKAVEAARQEIEGTRVIVQGSIDHRLQGWDKLSPEDQWKRFDSVLNDVKQGKVSTN